MLRRKLLTRALAAAGFVPATSLLAQAQRVPDVKDFAPAVGSWFVLVNGAPFSQHLFVFHSDGTMLSTNPDAGDSHTSDSDGIGVWKGGQVVLGAFIEINADRVTHQYVSKLRVDFKIYIHNDLFKGDATATYYTVDDTVQAVYPASFTATRITLAKS